MRVRLCSFLIPAVLSFAPAAAAARLDFFEGAVSLDGRTLTQNTQPELTTDDTIATPAGRAELELSGGVYLRIGQKSEVRVIAGSGEGFEVELLAGSLVVDSSRAGRFAPAAIRVGNSVTRIGVPGEYRFDASPAQLHVGRGSAEVFRGNAAPTPQGPGAIALDEQPAGAAGGDDLLDIWSANRRIHLFSTAFVSGPATAVAPEQPPPMAENDNVAGPDSSLGFLFLTGIPELLYIPQRPYRVGVGFFGPAPVPGYVPYAGAYAGAYPGPYSGAAGPRPVAPAFHPGAGLAPGLAFPPPPAPHIGHPVIGH